ncbi:unnamed protein product [Didymodactylos carnosus]|uniref:Integrase n=1 Tax=Didymodactylos carnosus TaxID=1234261 RepID=A0A815Z8W5_9BILA|nr:unnamed protein product [Didymodactylos carnosus]CAF1647643.1 unnamed protein product [Didymodactylos carnosus]CAF4447251.1 unnamed protein product [Didymodactylos carnosus]CAF4491243.1 unnamed protein product [Didymodactylos carnosus]
MLKRLRTLLTSLGYTAIHYSGHSFRIGAATSTAKAGVLIYLIKILEQWSSQAYRRYIRTSASCIIQVLTTITAV